ncbi:adenylate/guanylate cyclase domain-containing protein [bacterium]|nr:adenylate/guanylate cyclase domain-containing protein [bacterium]
MRFRERTSIGSSQSWESMPNQAFNITYWQKQKTRILDTLKNLGSVQEPIQAGRVIPDEQALSIGLGRRLKMAVLFLDISGFSARPSEDLGEQDTLLRILNLFFSEMVRIAEDFGGTVEKNTGDGLMAYFEDTSSDTDEL